ncbi:MAG: hypothetical protein LBG84_10080 [Treponema sp.]|nr:hypothetical protein [Treponema sp.]
MSRNFNSQKQTGISPKFFPEEGSGCYVPRGVRPQAITGGVIALFLLVLAALPAGAQDRRSLPVYIPVPTGGSQEQKIYFHGAFKMELIGTGYPLAESKAESLYTLELSIEDNPQFDPEYPVDLDNTHYDLQIALIRSADDGEILRFSFGFNNTDEMNRWNLTLIYTALANAVIPPGQEKGAAAAIDDRWQDQTFYLSLGAGMDVAFYLMQDGGKIATGSLMPAVRAGLEWRFVDFLALEVDPVKPRFIERAKVYAAASATLKGVIKFSSGMLEPYGGLEYALGLAGSPVPPLSMIAGIQVGFRAGAKSAWTLDVGITRNITDEFKASNDVSYNLMRFHIMYGIKFGFRDKKPKD